MAAQQDFWGQFEVAEYNAPQYDEKYWGQFETANKNKEALETSLNELPKNSGYAQTLDHDTEQLANILFTKEELQALRNKGSMGWVEYRQRNYYNWSDLIPIGGDWIKKQKATNVQKIAERIEKGEEVSEADRAKMTNYLKDYVELQVRGMSWSSSTAEGILNIPAFLVGWGAGNVIGGTALTTLKAGAGIATKAAVKTATKTAAKTAANVATKAAVNTATKTGIKAAVTGKIAENAGALAILTPTYAVKKYNERKIADGLNITDKGEQFFEEDTTYSVERANEHNVSNAFKSMGEGIIQMGSELTGGVFGHIAGKATGLIKTSFGKVATTNVARGISATTAKVYNMLPKSTRIKLEATAKVVDNLSKAAVKTGEQWKKSGKLTGFNGVGEEFGEERLADVLMVAFDLDQEKGYSVDQFLGALIPDPQQAMLELGIFTIGGSFSHSSQILFNNLRSKGYSEKEATTITQNLSEIEKENMANEILGEVKINEDIKESEVIKEQAKIETALKGGVSMTVAPEGQEQAKPKTLTDYKKDILSQKFDEGKIDTIKHKYNGRVINQVIKSQDNDFVYANRQFNQLINEIYKNPAIVDNAQEMEILENELDSIVNSLPYSNEEEVSYPYYEKFYNAVNSAGEYLEAKNKKGKVAADVMYDMADTAGATPSETDLAKKEWKEKGTKSKYFKKWFGDSKVVDENGKPLVVYHGTPNAGFETFKENSHFTANKEYAENYMSQGASSISYKKTANNPDVYEVYLSIKNPFDTRDEKARNIFLNEYQAYYSPNLTDKGMVDWFEVEELAEWLKENHPEYDGIIADEGGTGGYGEEVKDRGVSYIPFTPEQIKSVDNQGTFDAGNPNIYYDVEETSRRKTKKNYNSYNDFVKEFLESAEEAPEDYTISDIKEAMKDLGVTEDTPRIIKTPIEKLELRADRLQHIIGGGGDGHLPDKTRYKSINKMFATLERPDVVVQFENGNKDYLKIFKDANNTKNQIVVIHNDENGDFIYTSMPSDKGKNYFINQINKGEIIYKKGRPELKNNSAVNNIIPQSEKNITPINEKADVIEDELDTPITVADKIIQGESKWGKFYTDWVDRFTPIENLVKKAEQKLSARGGKKLDISSNPYYQARMYAGLVESIKQQVNDKTFVKKDGKIEITGEGFLPIINDYVEEVKDVEPNYDKAIEDLSDYLIASRYLLDLKDREGYEATEEQKLKALEDMTKLNLKYGDKIDNISKIADRIYAFNQRILHNLVDSGNMSQETYDKIIEQNPHHISYKRVMDDNNIDNAFVSKGKFTDAKSPVKKIRGSERDIQNIFVSTLEDVARILDVAERNKVARSIADLKNILPEYIQDKKPAMEKRTAKVKVNYDAKMRQQLLEAVKFFGRTFENVKSIKTPTGYALGSYSEEEQIVRKKLGSQDRTLAHEVGHMLDFALDVENQIKDNAAIMKEIKTLAEDRFASVIKLEEGEYVTEKGKTPEKYKRYAKTNKEAIANAFDLYFTSRDYVKRVAPETAKFIDNLFKGEYAFLNDIRPSSESAVEEIEQDVWTPSRNKPYGNVIGYFVDGKPKFIEVTKPVLDAVEGMNSQEIDFVNKFFTGSATMLRTGATITPEFAIRNFIRDQESAVIYIKNYNPFIDGVKGLFNVLGKKITGKNETYDEWVKAGGAFGSYMELNEKSVNKALKEFVGEGSKLRSIFDYGNPLKLAEEFSSIFEQATRLGMYTRSKMNGSSAMEAALEAREGTLDFGRSGSKGRKYNRFLPFFNAGIQGVDKMVRTFRDHPYLSSVKAIGSITLPQLALTGFYLFAAPDDDREEYLNIPQYQKDFFYCFKVGKNWYRIPKDFTLGYLFGSVPERFMTWAYQNKKPEGKDLANMAMTLFGSVSPINNPTDVLPPILRTMIENVANYDFFRGQHIYPEYMDNLEPSMRANKFNSETSKLLGEKLNMSPAKIDHTISSLLGTSGKYLTDAGDLMINSVREFNGEETNKKVSTLADAPFIRGFVIRDPVGYQAVSTNEFFENYKEVSQAHATYNKYKKAGDRQATREYKAKHELELKAYKRMNNTKKEISDLGKQMDKIYSNKTLTNKEKQERLQPLAKRISDKAFETNVWYGEFTKE